MSLREIVKLIINLIPKICFGIIIGVGLYGFFISPQAVYGSIFLVRVVLLSIICGLLCFVFYSKKELNNRQMWCRLILHFLLVEAVPIIALVWWGWIEATPLTIIPVVIIILIIYACVVAGLTVGNKNTADKLNALIQKRRQK